MENNKKKSIIPTIILTILSLLWIYPIITDPFKLFKKGISHYNYRGI